MAKHERTLSGTLGDFIGFFEDHVLKASMSASAEDGTTYALGETQFAMRVYERYSAIGGNRVSMSVAALEQNGTIHVTVITSGGSQAMFIKMLTLGEETFLDTAVQAIDAFERR